MKDNKKIDEDLMIELNRAWHAESCLAEIKSKERKLIGPVLEEIGRRNPLRHNSIIRGACRLRIAYLTKIVESIDGTESRASENWLRMAAQDGDWKP